MGNAGYDGLQLLVAALCDAGSVPSSLWTFAEQEITGKQNKTKQKQKEK